MAFSSNELTFAFYFDPPEKREMKPEKITLFERVEEPVKAVHPSIDRKRAIEVLSSLFLRDDVFLIAHNGKFEMEHIRTKLGLEVSIFRDTMNMAYLINETAQGFYSLDALHLLPFP
jgi:DNA polymerase I-like protein with 3'-5' exonuclease and polymerase domains